MTKTQIQWKEENDVKVTSNTDYIPEPILDFNDLDLPKSVFVGLERDNITEPTPIQAMGISAGMAGKNIIGISRTASGKTLAFLLPAIKDILSERNWVYISTLTRKEFKTFYGIY